MKIFYTDSKNTKEAVPIAKKQTAMGSMRQQIKTLEMEAGNWRRKDMASVTEVIRLRKELAEVKATYQAGWEQIEGLVTWLMAKVLAQYVPEKRIVLSVNDNVGESTKIRFKTLEDGLVEVTLESGESNGFQKTENA